MLVSEPGSCVAQKEKKNIYTVVLWFYTIKQHRRPVFRSGASELWSLWSGNGACLSSPKDQRVGLHVQVALAGQQVQSEEAIVAPAFPNLEVRGKFTYDVLGRVAGGLVDHFNTVLIPAKIKNHVTYWGREAKERMYRVSSGFRCHQSLI